MCIPPGQQVIFFSLIICQVVRRVSKVEGVVQLERSLTGAEISDIPERILVVHTQ